MAGIRYKSINELEGRITLTFLVRNFLISPKSIELETTLGCVLCSGDVQISTPASDGGHIGQSEETKTLVGNGS